MTPELTRAERRQLRRIERGVLVTDRAWAESAFGSATRQRLRRRAAVMVATDVAAVTALGFGVATASMPIVFAGIVLANVAICCHFDGIARSDARSGAVREQTCVVNGTGPAPRA